MRELEDRYKEELLDPYPKLKNRHSVFYLDKIHEEAYETLPYTDPEKPVTEEELGEVADMYFSWLGYLNARGISLKTIRDAADRKLDELIRRADYASQQPDFRTGWEVAKWFPQEKLDPLTPETQL